MTQEITTSERTAGTPAVVFQRFVRGHNHATIYNADCLEKMLDIPESSVDMVLADLPYGTTRCKWDSVIPFQPLWDAYQCVAKPSAAIVLTASQPFTSALIMSNAGLFRYCLVWDKIKGTGFLNAPKMPMRNHEDICVFYKNPPIYNPQMTHGHQRKQTFRRKHLQTEVYGNMKNDYHYDSTSRHPRSIITVSTDTQNSSVHPTQKPVALMEYLIVTYTNEGQTVLDNTMGSGTTGVACLRTKRNFIGIEKDPEHFKTACARLEAECNQGVLL